MKLFSLNLLLLLTFFSAQAQSIKKWPIKTTDHNSNSAIYSFCELSFSLSYSEDSSYVYTAECMNDNITYGVIFVKLKEPVESLEVGEGLLISYLDYLKSNFSIVSATGYGKGHTLRNNENTTGVLDFWQDKEKNNWKIKAWTDKAHIGVLYAHAASELPQQKVDLFLNGLNFPGM